MHAYSYVRSYPIPLHNVTKCYFLFHAFLPSASTLSQSTAPPTVSYLGTKPPPTFTASGGTGTAEERDQCQSQTDGEEDSTGVPSSSPSLSNVSAQLEAALEECSHKLQVLV